VDAYAFRQQTRAAMIQIPAFALGVPSILVWYRNDRDSPRSVAGLHPSDLFLRRDVDDRHVVRRPIRDVKLSVIRRERDPPWALPDLDRVLHLQRRRVEHQHIPTAPG